MLKLCQGNSKPLNNDNVLQIKLKSNLSLDKLQTTFSPSLVMAFFLPIDNHPTLANWNPKSALTHTHNPRIGSDLRSYLLLRGYLSMQEFFSPCTLATASGMERKTVDSYLTPSYIGHMVLAKEKDYTEEALRRRNSANALNKRLGLPFHQQKAQTM